DTGTATESRRYFCSGMEFRDDVAKLHHQPWVQLPLSGQMVEQRVIAEACHFQHRLDERAIAIPFETAIRRARQSAHGAIKHRRGAAIELELRAAEALALGERRIIEKRQLQRALHLEDAIADQKNDRDMRIDAARLFVGQAEARAA